MQRTSAVADRRSALPSGGLQPTAATSAGLKLKGRKEAWFRPTMRHAALASEVCEVADACRLNVEGETQDLLTTQPPICIGSAESQR